MADEAKTYDRPLPQPDPVTQPFWDSLKAHAIQLQRCGGCARFIYYPRAVCPSCLSDELTWTRVSGRGVVHAFTIPHRHPNRAFGSEVPYVVVLVELEEGVRLMSTVVDGDPWSVTVGDRVTVAWEPLSDGRHLYVFERDGAG